MTDRPARRAVTRQTAPRGTVQTSKGVPLKGLNAARGLQPGIFPLPLPLPLPYVVIPTEAAFWPTRDLLSPCL